MEEIPAFERAVDRRTLLKKVAVYAPPLVLAGGVLVGPGIATAARDRSSAVECSTESAASSSTASGGGSCTTILGALLADIAALQGIPASGRKEEDRKVAQAIARLTDATDPSKWTPDGNALVSSAGKKVFESLKQAVDQLMSSHSSNATIGAVASDVVAQSGALANLAVQNATLSSKQAAKAQKELDKGAQQAAAGHGTAAIDSYAHAWRTATGTPGDDGGDD